MQAKACLFVCMCAMWMHMCAGHAWVCLCPPTPPHPPNQTNDGEPVSPFSSPARGCAPVSWPWRWCAWCPRGTSRPASLAPRTSPSSPPPAWPGPRTPWATQAASSSHVWGFFSLSDLLWTTSYSVLWWHFVEIYLCLASLFFFFLQGGGCDVCDFMGRTLVLPNNMVCINVHVLNIL